MSEEQNIKEPQQPTTSKNTVTGRDLRMPKNFTQYSGEDVMSNFDGLIVHKTADEIKGKELFSSYAGWDFCGKVWWQNNLWNCEVWCYGSFQRTFSAETLDEIKSEVCSAYGYD